MTRGPLGGIRVVVTRDRRGAASMTAALEAAGAEVISMPLIEIADPPDWEAVDRAVERMRAGGYEWAIFSSANAAERFCDRAETRPPAATRVAAVGPATERALRDRGWKVDLVPERYTADDLAERVGDGRGDVLLPRPPDAPRALVDELQRRGWTVDEVIAYVNRAPAELDLAAEEVRDGRFDVMTFASGSAVTNFVTALGPPDRFGLGRDDPGPRAVACIGPATSAAAERAGFRVDVVPADHTVDGLVAAICERAAALVRARDGGNMGP